MFQKDKKNKMRRVMNISVQGKMKMNKIKFGNVPEILLRFLTEAWTEISGNK